MAIEAKDFWLKWNDEIRNSNPSELPAGLEPDDKLLLECGCYYVGDGPELRDYYAASLDAIEKTAPQYREGQYIKARAVQEMFATLLTRA